MEDQAGSSKVWKCVWTDCNPLKADDKFDEVPCTRNMEVTTEMIAELDESKVTCPRCRVKLRLLQKLMERKPDAFKKGVSGICEHCLAKQNRHDPICTCNKTFKQYEKYPRQPDSYFDRVQSSAPKSFLPKEMRGLPVTEKFKPPFTIRRWHSEQSVIDSFANIMERDFKKNLVYFFPQRAKETETLGERHHSSEIIKQTADRLKSENLRKLGLPELDDDLYDYIIDPSTGKAILKLNPSIVNDDAYDYFIDPYTGQTFRKAKEKRTLRDVKIKPFEDDLHYDYIIDPFTGKTVRRLRQRMSPTEEDMYEYVTDPHTGKTVKKFKRPSLTSEKDMYEYVTDPSSGRIVRKRILSADDDIYEYVTDPITGKRFQRRISPSEDEYVYESVIDPLTGKTVWKLKKRMSSLEKDIYEYFTDPSTNKRRISSADEDMYEYITEPFTGKIVKRLKKMMLPSGEDMYEYVTDPFTGKTVKKLKQRLSSLRDEDEYEYVTDPSTGKIMRVPVQKMSPSDEDMYEYITDPFTGKTVKKLKRGMLPSGEDIYEYFNDPFTGKTVRKLKKRLSSLRRDSSDEDMYEYITEPLTGKIVKRLKRRMLTSDEDMYEYVTDPFTRQSVRKIKKRLPSFEEEDVIYEYFTDPTTGKINKRPLKTKAHYDEDMIEYVIDPFTGKTVKTLKKPRDDLAYQYESDPDQLTDKIVKKFKKPHLPFGEDKTYEFVTDPLTGKTVKKFKKPLSVDMYEYITDPYTGKKVKKKQQTLSSDENLQYFTDPYTGKVFQKVKMRKSPSDKNMYEFLIDPFTGKKVQQLKKERTPRMLTADEEIKTRIDPFTGKTVTKLKRAKTPLGPMRKLSSEEQIYEYIIDPITGQRVKQDKDGFIMRGKDMFQYVVDPITGKKTLKKIGVGREKGKIPGKKGYIDYDDQLAGRKSKKKGMDDDDIYFKSDKRKPEGSSVIIRSTEGKKSQRPIVRNIFKSRTEPIRDGKDKKNRVELSEGDVKPKYFKTDTLKNKLKDTRSLSEIHLKKRHDPKSDIVPLPKYIREIQAANKKKMKGTKSLPSEVPYKKGEKVIVFDPKREPRQRSPKDKKNLKAIYDQLSAPSLVDVATKKSKIIDKVDMGIQELMKKSKGSIFKLVKDESRRENKRDNKKKIEPGASEDLEHAEQKKTDELPVGQFQEAKQELILKLMDEKEPRVHPESTSEFDYAHLPHLLHSRKWKKKKSDTDESIDMSELELNKDDTKYVFEGPKEIIRNNRISKKIEEVIKTPPKILQFEDDLFDIEVSEPKDDVSGFEPRLVDPKAGVSNVFKYALSDRQFIENGYTVLPTTKTLRKINLYRMRPAQPELDWFERNKEKGSIKYSTGEKLAEIDKKGQGRWFYKNGKVALEYYKTKDKRAQHRFVIRSSGDPDENCRSQPVTVLGIFDHFGGGVIFDHGGKIRLKYNQSEGVVLDRKIGPVSHWQWHSLNQPPMLQQVMVNETLENKDETITSLGAKYELPTRKRKDDEEMLTLEYENYIKENTFAKNPYKPFIISSKIVKINKQFTLKMLDQSRIYLTFRDGTANMKINLGMVLDAKELVDIDIAEVGNVAKLSASKAFGDKTRSMEKLTLELKTRRHEEAVRLERLRKSISELTVDLRTAPLSRPLRPVTNNTAEFNYCNPRNHCQNNKYYSTSIFN